MDSATSQTRPLMGTAVRRYVAYHHEGMEPGTHLGVARVARFTHSREMLQRHPRLSMTALGSACGYFDQAHMAREWNQLAGEPASSWWADEGVRFFQAPSLEASAS